MTTKEVSEATTRTRDDPTILFPVVPEERLTADECAYHAKVCGAVTMTREATMRAQIAADAWLAHLVERYALGEADRVEVDGTIVRAETEA